MMSPKNYLLFIITFIYSLYYTANAQPFDGHLSLDGLNDNAYIASPVFTDQSDFTFELFLYDCGSLTDFKIVDAQGSTAGSGIEIRYLKTTKKIQVIMNNGTTSTTKSVSYTVASETWNHIAVTHDESDTTNIIYVNGDSIFSFTSDIAFAGDLGIGSSDDGPGKNYFFRGRIDEVRISNSERYTGSTYTVPTSAFSDDANTLGLWHFDDGQNIKQFADASGNGYTLTGYGGGHTNAALWASADTTIAEGESVQLSATGGSIFYWTPPTGLSDTLVASPTATPDSTITYTVSIYDTNYCETSFDVTVTVLPYVAPQDAPFNGYLSLDGVDDYALINSTIWPNSSDFTVETFFKICDGNYHTLFDALNSTAGDGIQVVIYGGGNYIEVGMIGASGYNSGSYHYFSGIGLDLTEWHHLAITHNNTDSLNIIYIDGDSVASFISDFESGSSVKVGGGNQLDGFMDEFRISNTLRYTGNFNVPTNEFISDANTKVLWHFNDGDFATSFDDESTNGYTLTGYAGAHVIEKVLMYPSDTTIKYGQSVNLVSSGGNFYEWSPTASLSDSTTSSVIATPSESTTYNLIISDSNSCEIANVDILVSMYEAFPIGDYLAFDGVNDYAYTPYQIMEPVSDFTVEFLFKLCDSVNNSVLVDALGSTAGYGMDISHSSNLIQIGMIGPTGYTSYSYLNAPVSINYSNWHHLAFVHSDVDSLNVLYIDGDSVGSFIGAFKPATFAVLGKADHVDDYFLDGYMDEIRVSDEIRYTANFTPPTTAHNPDQGTVVLWHFDSETTSQEFYDETNNDTIYGYNELHLNSGYSDVSADTTIMLGDSVMLVASGGDVYSWNSKNKDTVLVSPIVTTTYYVYVTNFNGCDSVTVADTVIVTVDTTIVTGIYPNTIVDEFTYNVYVNSSREVNITYGLHQAANVQVELYNILGERIAVLINKNQTQGTYSLHSKLQDAGIYLMHFTVNGKDYVKKISLL